MSPQWEGCPSSRTWFQGTAWQNSLWIWLKARLIEFWYVIKSSNKSAQIPVQLTIQHSWAPQANYDEVIISAKGSALNGSFVQRVESPPLKRAQPWGKGICSTKYPKDPIKVSCSTAHAASLGRVLFYHYFKAGYKIKRWPWIVSDAPDASSQCNYNWY